MSIYISGNRRRDIAEDRTGGGKREIGIKMLVEERF